MTLEINGNKNLCGMVRSTAALYSIMHFQNDFTTKYHSGFGKNKNHNLSQEKHYRGNVSQISLPAWTYTAPAISLKTNSGLQLPFSSANTKKKNE